MSTLSERENQKCYTHPSLRILLVSSSARLLVSVKMRDYSGKINKEHISKKQKEAEYQYQYIQTITKIYLVFRLSHYLFQKLDKPFKKKKTASYSSYCSVYKKNGNKPCNGLCKYHTVQLHLTIYTCSYSGRTQFLIPVCH